MQRRANIASVLLSHWYSRNTLKIFLFLNTFFFACFYNHKTESKLTAIFMKESAEGSFSTSYQIGLALPPFCRWPSLVFVTIWPPGVTPVLMPRCQCFFEPRMWRSQGLVFILSCSVRSCHRVSVGRCLSTRKENSAGCMIKIGFLCDDWCVVCAW